MVNHGPCCGRVFKAGVHPETVLWLGIMILTQLSHLVPVSSNQTSLSSSHISTFGVLCNFLAIFGYIWGQIIFSKD